MQAKGIRKFQEERSKIIINYINQACLTLLEKGIDISRNSVSQEIERKFKKHKIDIKYLVDAQTIGRNYKYSSIWKKYKKKQKRTLLTKTEKKNKEFEFSIRDKYDMLKQDYIELNDKFNYLIEENKNNIRKIKALTLDNSKRDFNTAYNSNNNLSSDILFNIQKMLKNDSVIIIEKSESIIIKNFNIKDDNKIIVDKEEWYNI